MSAFSLSGAQLGNLAASYFYAYLIMQIPVGLLVDRFGPRRVVTIAIFVCAIGLFVFAKANTFLVAGIGRFVVGLGAAFAVINTFKLTANWFPPRRFAFMAGLLLSIGMLGAVGGQAPLSYYIAHTGNWRTAMLNIAWAGIVLAIIFWLIIRDKPKGMKEDEPHLRKKRFWKGFGKLVSNPQNWLLSVFSGLLFSPIMAFGELWGVNFIRDAFQMDHHHAAQAVSMIFIGFAVGAPFFGWMSDKIGRRKTMMYLGNILSIILLVITLYFPSPHIYFSYPLLFLFGAFISSFLLSFTMIREVNAPFVIATAMGFMNTFNAIVGAITDPLIGSLLDSKWTGQMVDGARAFSVDAYRYALTTLPVYLIIGLILLFFIKETHCKQMHPENS